MPVKFTDLPYGLNALEPFVSRQTMQYHYGKHHRHYVSTLNKLIAGTSYDKMGLEEIVVQSFDHDEDIFHNSAQAWNHEFFWNCLQPHPSGKPRSETLRSLSENFGSVSGFKEEFVEAGKNIFGSGWVWLVKNYDHSLSIVCLGNAGNPLNQGQIPLLVCDVWEHAYYLDYHHERAKFLNALWGMVNWDFVEENMKRTEMKISA